MVVIRRILYAVLCLWGIEESIYGLLQIFGRAHIRHTAFLMTGHFDNPGPYGGFLACILSVIVVWLFRHRNDTGKDALSILLKVISCIAGAFCLIVLPATMSRSAWAAVIIVTVIALLSDTKLRTRLLSNKVVLSCAIAGIAALAVASFFLKEDSALGRLHIWHIDALAIMNSPWKGYGVGFEMGAYGEAQAAFFHKHLAASDISQKLISIAGCPEYPFNEFLGAGMSFGIPAMLFILMLSILFNVNLWKNGSAFAGGTTALFVFALGSYPMVHWQFWALLCICASGFSGHREKRLAQIALPAVCMLIVAGGGLSYLAKLKQNSRQSPKYYYETGHDLHLSENWSESNSYLLEGAKKSSDPMFHIIIGKNYEAMGMAAEAEAEYDKAHYMVPCRLYPLVRKMRLQIRQGRNEDAIQTAKTVAGMPVNDRLIVMKRLKKECAIALDSLLTLEVDGKK